MPSRPSERRHFPLQDKLRGVYSCALKHSESKPYYVVEMGLEMLMLPILLFLPSQPPSWQWTEPLSRIRLTAVFLLSPTSANVTTDQWPHWTEARPPLGPSHSKSRRFGREGNEKWKLDRGLPHAPAQRPAGERHSPSPTCISLGDPSSHPTATAKPAGS